MTKPKSHEVRFFHDFGSPFSYLGSTQIEKVCARSGAELIWHPMLLGAVFKAVGQQDVPVFAMPAPKQQYYFKDMHRFAELYDVPFAFPSRFPMRTLDALRLVLVAEDESKEQSVALTHRIYLAYWGEDRDISKSDVLVSLCGELGLDGEAMMARTKDDDIKQRLIQRTQAAVDAGVFGAPSFLVDRKELFWGQDRLRLLENSLTAEPGEA